MWQMVEDRVLTSLRDDPEVAALIATLEDDVRAGRITASHAAERIIEAYGTR